MMVLAQHKISRSSTRYLHGMIISVLHAQQSQGIHMKPYAEIKIKKGGVKNSSPEFIEKFNAAVARMISQIAYLEKLEARRKYHEQVLNMMVDPEFAQHVRSIAFQRIAIWREGKTCSEFYSDTWERIMKMDSIEDMKQAVVYDKAWADALQQNSPISGIKLENDA